MQRYEYKQNNKYNSNISVQKRSDIERTILNSEEPYQEIQRTPSITNMKQQKSWKEHRAVTWSSCYADDQQA